MANRFAQLFRRPAAPRATGGGLGAMPMGGNEIQAPSSTDENLFLAPYGLHNVDPSQANPYLFFGNQGWAGNHPRLASGIDSALGVVANMGEPSPTIGGNISNVARALLGNREMHQQNINQQVMAPYAIASQLQQMDIGRHQIANYDAQAAMDQAHAAYWNNLAVNPKQSFSRIKGQGGLMYRMNNATGETLPIMMPDGMTQLKIDASDPIGKHQPFYQQLGANSSDASRMAMAEDWLNQPENQDDPVRPHLAAWLHSMKTGKVQQAADIAAAVANATGKQPAWVDRRVEDADKFFKNKRVANALDFDSVRALQTQKIIGDRNQLPAFNAAVDEAQSTYRDAVAEDPDLTPTRHLNSKLAARGLGVMQESAPAPGAPTQAPAPSTRTKAAVPTGGKNTTPGAPADKHKALLNQIIQMMINPPKNN